MAPTALMIGLTLVVTMTVFGASLKASFGTILNDATTADLFVTAPSLQIEGFSPQVTEVVADVPGVGVVSSTSYGQALFAGAPSAYASVDAATVEQVLDLGDGETDAPEAADAPHPADGDADRR